MSNNSENRAKAQAKRGAAIVVLAAPLVMLAEGLRTSTYADPVGIPTVCYGSTAGHAVARQHWSEGECAALLGAELLEHWHSVAPCIQRSITDRQAAAILSWSYNVGAGAACDSTLMRKLNEGAPAFVWCAELSRWVYARGQKLNGLVARRQKEQELCES